MTGLVFHKFYLFDEPLYRAKYGEKSGCDVHLSKYKYKERENEPFISCSVWRRNGNEGCARGCDSIEEVVEMIRTQLIEKERKRGENE